ncbi:hypothetical protein [Kitasatospora cheerisanensis]|uniref:hypothetical protein n=1 Tax=Kitasatospora cheerisanensis TaxID=81942 RepID=UPI00055E9246|nr:hypothetical protein [Kitasatospora cheerisanensis]
MTTSTVAPPHHIPAQPVRGLSFSSLMSPDAVHKSAAGEVFLTDAVRLAEDHVAVAARWHRDRFLPAPGAPSAAGPPTRCWWWKPSDRA